MKQENKKMVFIVVVLLVALVATAVFAIVQYNQKNALTSGINESYSKDLTNLVTSLKDLNVTMNKTFLNTDKASLSQNLMKVNKLSELSVASLVSLPISQVEKQNVTKYLNIVSDYSFSLNKNVLNDVELTSNEKKQYNDLTKLSSSVYKAAYEFQMSMKDEDNKTSFYNNKNTKEMFFSASAIDTNISKTFKSIDNELVAMPTMIYDGPFSAAIAKMKPKITQSSQITKDEATKIIQKIFKADNTGSNITYVSESKGKIPLYTFTIKKSNSESYTAQLTKNGGKLIMVSGTEGNGKASINMKQAQAKAEAFLKYLGITNMKVSYHEKYENTAVFNFAYTQNDTTIYPDLIKVQISLKTGSLVGYEATGYYSSHYERTISTPKYTISQAKEVLNIDLKVTKASKALIPTASKGEVLCYEFKGTYNNNIYLIYINANTLKEEQIFQVVEADESVLVM